jgi:hypothetical protein
MYNAVVTINDTHWPAYRKLNGTLVDLRLFDPTDRSPKPRLIFRPEKLRELGIPDRLIEAVARFEPQGFILFEDLPDQKPQSRPAPTDSRPKQSTK